MEVWSNDFHLLNLMTPWYALGNNCNCLQMRNDLRWQSKSVLELWLGDQEAWLQHLSPKDVLSLTLCPPAWSPEHLQCSSTHPAQPAVQMASGDLPSGHGVSLLFLFFYLVMLITVHFVLWQLNLFFDSSMHEYNKFWSHQHLLSYPLPTSTSLPLHQVSIPLPCLFVFVVTLWSTGLTRATCKSMGVVLASRACVTTIRYITEDSDFTYSSPQLH